MFVNGRIDVVENIRLLNMKCERYVRKFYRLTVRKAW